MKDQNLLVDEFEQFCKKFELKKCILLIPTEEHSFICAHSEGNPEEELNLATSYSKLLTEIGSFEYETIDSVVEAIQEIKELQTSQVIYEQTAYELAKSKLSEENLILLEESKVEKEKAWTEERFEDAAKWRETELKILNITMNS